MVWGCIWSNDDRLLVPVENKVDSDAHIPIEKEHVIHFQCIHETFQQDFAPAHASLQPKTKIIGKKFDDSGKLTTTISWYQ